MTTQRTDLNLTLSSLEWVARIGSIITVASLFAFYLIYGFLFRNHIGGWAFVTFASPGFLFLLHWLVLRAGEKQVVR